ncbi:MAG: hypothetical protein ACLSAF_09590 [Intestinimonas sp.]
MAVIAMKLKEVFGLADINELPIIYNIAWYEQKAVIVLLALLYLGVKNIHLGPTLPAFLSQPQRGQSPGGELSVLPASAPWRMIWSSFSVRRKERRPHKGGRQAGNSRAGSVFPLPAPGQHLCYSAPGNPGAK